jgi:hypothetical protein
LEKKYKLNRSNSEHAVDQHHSLSQQELEVEPAATLRQRVLHLDLPQVAQRHGHGPYRYAMVHHPIVRKLGNFRYILIPEIINMFMTNMSDPVKAKHVLVFKLNLK